MNAILAHFVTPVIGLLGVVGNVLTVSVLSTRHYRGRGYARLLLLLALADLSFILLGLAVQITSNHRLTELDQLMTAILFPICTFALSVSALTTLAICVERYIMVSSPLGSR